jgi:hypothetical protein
MQTFSRPKKTRRLLLVNHAAKSPGLGAIQHDLFDV